MPLIVRLPSAWTLSVILAIGAVAAITAQRDGWSGRRVEGFEAWMCAFDVVKVDDDDAEADAPRRPIRGVRSPTRVDAHAAPYPTIGPPAVERAPEPPPTLSGPCAHKPDTSLDTAPVDAVSQPLLVHPPRPHCKRSPHADAFVSPRDAEALLVKWRHVEDLWFACRQRVWATPPPPRRGCPAVVLR